MRPIVNPDARSPYAKYGKRPYPYGSMTETERRQALRECAAIKDQLWPGHTSRCKDPACCGRHQ